VVAAIDHVEQIMQLAFAIVADDLCRLAVGEAGDPLLALMRL
jgi:hypothetical protein